MGLANQLRARWRSFAGEADQTRQASDQLWSLIRAHKVEGDPGMPALPQLEWPVGGRLTSGFGMRHGRMHEGIDIAIAVGDPVYAALRGVVLLASELGVYGNVVVIGHGRSLATVYAHLGTVEVAPEDSVEPKRRLGTVGSTGRTFGAHLHFEVRFDGTAVDPLVFLGEATGTWAHRRSGRTSIGGYSSDRAS